MNIAIKTLFILLMLVSCGHQAKDPRPEDKSFYSLWNQCGLNGVLPYDIFHMAMTGFNNIDSIKNRDIITIIDFSKPSSEERFFVIDLKNRKLVFKTLVAHGKNSGDIYAGHFSNTEGSLESCPGFFITAETYSGKHGYSLRLDGLEKGINDNARSREIVIHGADYVSKDFVEKYGRIGRSWGCPALPSDLSKKIIDTISNGTCLFIYTDNEFYRKKSGLSVRQASHSVSLPAGH